MDITPERERADPKARRRRKNMYDLSGYYYVLSEDWYRSLSSIILYYNNIQNATQNGRLCVFLFSEVVLQIGGGNWQFEGDSY